jgi:predicted membrane channel-forming protein YqfA (hemolysin III family)
MISYSVLLLSLGVACVVAVFRRQVHDTLAQRVGLSVIGVWCFAALPRALQQDPQPAAVWLLAGVAVYVVSTTYAAVRRA